jgi:hypothetical protein
LGSVLQGLIYPNPKRKIAIFDYKPSYIAGKLSSKTFKNPPRYIYALGRVTQTTMDA